jgi:hypothetical protein
MFIIMRFNKLEGIGMTAKVAIVTCGCGHKMGRVYSKDEFYCRNCGSTRKSPDNARRA